MSLDFNLLEQLLLGEEGPTLDFKRDQYAFEGASDDDKGELLKDVLAFANTGRQTTAYILIGVDEVKGRRSKVIGVNAHLDDAQLHQFVNSKTQRPVEFSYSPFPTNDGEIGVIEIPVQACPIYLKKGFGNLYANAVYKRDSSSTAVATPDEIARMGEMRVSSGTPQLVLEWADLDRCTVLPSPHSVHTLILNPPLPDSTFEEPRPTVRMGLADYRDYYRNDNYSKDAINYIFERAFLKPLGLRLRNCSGTVGKRILFVGSVTKANADCVWDCTHQPKRPYRDRMAKISASIVPLASQLQISSEPRVKELDDRWEITIDFGDVRPCDEVWTTSELFIGSMSDRITRLEGELRGDNIQQPSLSALEIRFEVEQRPMERADVKKYLDDC